MTTLKIYNAIIEIKAAHEASDTVKAYRLVLELADTLKEQITAAEHKSKGTSAIRSALKKYLKTVPKYNTALQGVYKAADGEYYLSNSYSAYRLNQSYDLPSVPHASIWDAAKNAIKKPAESVALHVDIVGLNAFIAVHKKDSAPYIVEAEGYRIAFNPSYLLNFCLLFGDTIHADAKSNKNPAYAAGSIGEGVLLPIMLRK